LHASSDPLLLAQAFRDALGLVSLYLADLDAIAGASPNLALYERLARLDVDLWVDAGLRDGATLTSLLSRGAFTIVAALESLDGPAALASIIDQARPERVVFSLDLRDGRSLCATGSRWETVDPLTLCRLARDSGVRRILLLDLGRVGRGAGVGTLPLLEALAALDPGLEITIGGGVAGVDELIALKKTAASAVLIGSALHDGRIGASELGRLIDR